MAPRTRSSQMGEPNTHARAAQNENQVIFQGSTHMGAPNQGKTASVNRNVVHQNVPISGKSNPS